MGRATDAGIRAWQEAAGIVPARGRRAEILTEMLWEAVRIVRRPATPRPSDPTEPWVDWEFYLNRAVELIQIITLERAGIRDGDGRCAGGCGTAPCPSGLPHRAQPWHDAGPG